MHENGSNGTDHGDGGLAFVLGGGVRGGLYGSWPGLADPALSGFSGLAVTTDLRHVLAEVLDARLGSPDAAAIFPGFAPAPLGLLDPRS